MVLACAVLRAIADDRWSVATTRLVGAVADAQTKVRLGAVAGGVTGSASKGPCNGQHVAVRTRSALFEEEGERGAAA